MKPKLSIVLPTYNVEQYIARCVNSILRLEFQNYEVIFVNDGSTDKTKEAFESLQLDSRFRMITTKNAGAGHARNCGLRVCRGEYVYFMDPDDELVGDPFIKGLPLLDRNEADLLFFGYIQKDMDSCSETSYALPEEMASRNQKEFRAELFIQVCANISANAVWNKVIRRSYLLSEGIEFPNMRAGQDAVFSWNMYRNIGRCVAITGTYYCYYSHRPGSIRSSYVANKFSDDIKAVQLAREVIAQWHMGDQYLNHYVSFAVYAIREEIRNQMRAKHTDSTVISRSSLYKALIKIPMRKLSWKNRVKIFLTKLSAHGLYKPMVLLMR